MEKHLEEKIQEEIVRRAFEKADLKTKQMETRLTLEALAEMTGLSGEELSAIEKEVRDRPPQKKDTFFSIKHQVVNQRVHIRILHLPLPNYFPR